MKNINYKKKLAQLKYKDLILDLHKNQKSIRDITNSINYRLARTNLKVSLSIFLQARKSASITVLPVM